MAEQGTHKPLVGSSNLPFATEKARQIAGLFFDAGAGFPRTQVDLGACRLLVSQGVDGVEAGGSLGRVDAEEEAHGC